MTFIDKLTAAAHQAMARLAVIAGKTSALRGWRRYLVAGAAGGGAATAMAPFYFLPLLFVAFPALIWLLDGASEGRRLRRSFAIGWAFGFGYFLVGVYWTSLSLLVQADQFAWLIPFAITLMPAGLALFPAAACAAYAAIPWRGAERVIGFAVLWSLLEFARGHVLTGFPWNLVGQAFAATPAAQLAAYVGGYGLSFIIVLTCVLPAGGARFSSQSSAPKFSAWPAVGALALLAGAFSVGLLRLGLHAVEVHDDVRIVIVQPNLSQREKIDRSRQEENFRKHVRLSDFSASSAGGATIYIWPENAAPLLLSYYQTNLETLGAALPPGATLVTGSVRMDAVDGARNFYNSVHALTNSERGLELSATYDKHHLVPFGEYVPLAGLIGRLGISSLNAFASGGLSAGDAPRTIRSIPGAPAFAPLVCYEAIFPGEMYPKGDRPQWLLNVTNDAWFGNSSGPRQHFDQARLRAIEEGLPLARAANTGVSAIIDPLGRVIDRAPLFVEGRIESALPAALEPTLFAMFKNWVYEILLLAAVALLWAIRIKCTIKSIDK